MKILPTSDPLAKKLLLYGLGVTAASTAASAQTSTVVFTTSGLTASNIAFSLQNTIVPTSETSANTANTATNAQFAITTQGSNKGAGADNSQGISANYLIETISKANTSGTATNYALDLPKGATIGSNATFTQMSVLNASATGNGNFTTGTSGFLGFEILAGAPGNKSGLNEFGYANITVNGFNTNNFTLNNYAYDNSGAAITTGAVPEPATTTALLVAGAVGVAALRRYRVSARVALGA